MFVLYLKDYTLQGEFGKATDNFSHTSRVIEKTTYGNLYFTIIVTLKSAWNGSCNRLFLLYCVVYPCEAASQTRNKCKVGLDFVHGELIVNCNCYGNAAIFNIQIFMNTVHFIFGCDLSPWKQYYIVQSFCTLSQLCRNGIYDVVSTFPSEGFRNLN